ncbi:MAG TPA: hypothetical protein VGJ13_04710 [Pseudonocardiaceae bacterium]|jgi:hypothetical protein
MTAPHEPDQLDTGDAAPFIGGLQNDRNLYSAKLAAGVVSAVALVAMIIMPPARTPNPAWTVVLVALAIGLSVAISTRLVRDRVRRGKT